MENIRVIIVDDTEIIVKTLELYLNECENVEIVGTASNGQEAYDLYKDKKPNVILTDMQMPIMTGLELIEKITKEDKEEIRTVLITGESLPSVYEKTHELGIEKIIKKPFTKEQIVEMVEKLKQPKPETKVVEKEEIKPKEESTNNLVYFRVIGQYHGTYILCEFDDGLYIIDQHAAAERINFEKYSRLLGTTSSSIPLLVPLLLEYTYNEIKQIEENKNVLETLGIYFESFSNTSIRISEVPSYFVDIDLEVYIKDVIEMILNKVKVSSLDIRLNAIATIACKASIKANHALSNDDMSNLIKNLLKCENPNTCPHGRPTMLKYTNYELEKFFKRAG